MILYVIIELDLCTESTYNTDDTFPLTTLLKMAKDSRQETLNSSVTKTRFCWRWWVIFFLPYLPIGFILCVWRVCTTLQVILLLLVVPESVLKRYLLRALFAVLGLVVVTKGQPAKTKVMVSNKVSLLDHIALHLATACMTVTSGSQSLPLNQLFPWWNCPSNNDQEILEAALALPEFRENGAVVTTPYLVQPEPHPTTGTHSLLKFRQWPFSLATDVQPVALSLLQPYPLSLSAVNSSGWLDLLLLFSMPVTIFHVKFLPVVHKMSDQSVEEFSGRVQKVIADVLHISTSQITGKDVQEWLMTESTGPHPQATGVAVPSQQPRPMRTTTDSGHGIVRRTRDATGEERDALETQVCQVTSVLPQVPHTVIRADLKETGSVDITIANLLEGRVQYTPSAPPTSITTSSLLRRRGNAAQRQLSLEERKRELLENARRRYKEKNGL